VLGRFLFRWRGVIGLAAFGVVFWLARPTVGSCFAGLAFVLAGLAVRFWASGYIGIEGRAREIGASRRVGNGPYRLLRHPLYVGNFLLVTGMLVALRPGVVVSVAVLLLFVLEYAIIVAAEERYISAKWKVESGNDKGESKEGKGERGKGEGESGVADGEWRETHCPTGASEANRERFSFGRAMCEWRTWLVTGVAFGLALLKAAVAAR